MAEMRANRGCSNAQLSPLAPFLHSLHATSGHTSFIPNYDRHNDDNDLAIFSSKMSPNIRCRVGIAGEGYAFTCLQASLMYLGGHYYLMYLGSLLVNYTNPATFLKVFRKKYSTGRLTLIYISESCSEIWDHFFFLKVSIVKPTFVKWLPKKVIPLLQTPPPQKKI